jgi:Protein of unknown function (DUF3352)
LPSVRPRPARPRSVAPARVAIASTLLLAIVSGILAGCGSSHTTAGTTADPAFAVPASAPLYASAVVRPDGSLKAAALAAGRTLTHQADPYLRLLAALQTPGSAPLSFNRDVASWLGPRAGVFLTSLNASSSLLEQLQQGLLGGSSTTTSAFPFTAKGGVQGALVLDTTNPSGALSFLSHQAGMRGAHTASYRGIGYRVAPDGVAAGIVARLAVIGSEAGLRGVIDTTLGGPSLAHAAGYSKLLTAAPAGALGHVYTNPGSSPSTAHGGTAKPQGLAALLRLLAGDRQANISLVPSATSIALDADTLPLGSTAAQTGGLAASSAEGARALGELPGESWLAVGLGNVGATLGADAQGLGSLASLGGQSSESSSSESSTLGSVNLSLKGILAGLLAPLDALSSNSAQAQQDFLSWMGSAGIFTSGTSLLDLKAGVVISSKNPARSHAAVAELATELRQTGGSVQSVSIPGADAAVTAKLTGLPVMLDIANGQAANGQTKFIIGLGEASVQEALNPSSTLSSAASLGAAASALGEGVRPSLTVDFPTFLSLLEGVGLSEDPTISKFVPYLRSLTTLAGGGKSLGGGIERFRLVVGLQMG